MIIDKKIKIIVDPKRDRTYYKLGYYDKKINKDPFELIIKIEDLIKTSKLKIHVKCDVCGLEKLSQYDMYLKNISHGGFCACLNCSQIKIKLTNLERYGDENYNNRKKSKKTCIEYYGVDNPGKSAEIKKKAVSTVRNKEGGYEKVWEKGRNTMKNVYGHEHALQNEEFFEKMLKTNLERYGDEKYNNREKSKKTCIEIYGVDNPMSVKSIRTKMIKTKQNLGLYVKDSDRDDFSIYKLKVTALTKKNKKILLENWNGLDYYDNEYIKDNFKFKHMDKRYPTVDHIMSTKYGFENNITPEEIAKLENLCMTKRSINSAKGAK